MTKKNQLKDKRAGNILRAATKSYFYISTPWAGWQFSSTIIKTEQKLNMLDQPILILIK